MRKIRLRRKLLLTAAVGLSVVSLSFLVSLFPGSKPQLSLSRVLGVHDAAALKALDWRFPVDDTYDDRVIIMRKENSSSRVLYFGHEQIHLRVNGIWLPANDVAWLNGEYFCAEVEGRSRAEFVIAVVPRNTQSVRLITQYRYQSRADKSCNLLGYQASPGHSTLPKWMVPACSLRPRSLTALEYFHKVALHPLLCLVMTPSCTIGQKNRAEQTTDGQVKPN